MKTFEFFASAVFWVGLSAVVLQAVYSKSNADEAAPLQFNTGDDVSFSSGAPNYFEAFAPELPEMLARMPQVDAETGLYVSEIKPGLFYVTEGVYQSAFLVTDDGVIVFDAPPSFAHKLPDAIRQHAPDKSIRYLVYSHGHSDHIGGASVFGDIDALEVVAHGDVAHSIAIAKHPGILAATETYNAPHSFSLGGETVELTPASFHAEDVDTIIYLPKQKFVLAVDTITPGEVPFMNFGATSDVGAYMAFFDMILEYEFDHILSGHVSVLGTREDVIIARDYANDVWQTVGAGMADFFDRFNSTFADIGHKNANLAYRATIEAVRRDCARQIIDRWTGKLSVVEVWADSHCEAVILYKIMH
ncbi:MBL fold metallo-hydrolase [Hyphococcus flavus]|uniref:MBL fold metallo-hydrolase n=1 Tax=Hyphococcus flavus TaxID=1866326 RepID=A0AAF0CB67_9PROT|nr:MBL fold metallo-hydrolase [Hyphococcus flavus]WDI30100.1 MBL fold metallo-hydrolase [Hyphococcus flavus]